jgi:hypothetical protein
MRRARNVARKLNKKNEYRLFVGDPDGGRTLRRPTHRWVYSIKMDLGKTGWCVVD